MNDLSQEDIDTAVTRCKALMQTAVAWADELIGETDTQFQTEDTFNHYVSEFMTHIRTYMIQEAQDRRELMRNSGYGGWKKANRPYDKDKARKNAETNKDNGAVVQKNGTVDFS